VGEEEERERERVEDGGGAERKLTIVIGFGPLTLTQPTAEQFVLRGFTSLVTLPCYLTRAPVMIQQGLRVLKAGRAHRLRTEIPPVVE